MTKKQIKIVILNQIKNNMLYAKGFGTSLKNKYYEQIIKLMFEYQSRANELAITLLLLDCYDLQQIENIENIILRLDIDAIDEIIKKQLSN